MAVSPVLAEDIEGGIKQSAHYAACYTLASGFRLRQRYFATTNSISDGIISREIDDIRSFLATQPNVKQNMQNSQQENYMFENLDIKKAAERFIDRIMNEGILQNVKHFPSSFLALEQREEFIAYQDMHPKELLALIWIAAKDKDSPMMGNKEKNDEDIVKIKNSIIYSLMEGQRAYNKHVYNENGVNGHNYAKKQDGVILASFDRYVGKSLEEVEDGEVILVEKHYDIIDVDPIEKADLIACAHGTFSKIAEALHFNHPDVNVHGYELPQLDLNMDLKSVKVSVSDMAQVLNQSVQEIFNQLSQDDKDNIINFKSSMFVVNRQEVTGQDILDKVFSNLDPDRDFFYPYNLSHPESNPILPRPFNAGRFDELSIFGGFFGNFLEMLKDKLIDIYGNALDPNNIVHENGVTLEEFYQIIPYMCDQDFDALNEEFLAQQEAMGEEIEGEFIREDGDADIIIGADHNNILNYFNLIRNLIPEGPGAYNNFINDIREGGEELNVEEGLNNNFIRIDVAVNIGAELINERPNHFHNDSDSSLEDYMDGHEDVDADEINFAEQRRRLMDRF